MVFILNQGSERHYIISLKQCSEAVSSEAIMTSSMQLIKKMEKRKINKTIECESQELCESEIHI